VPDVYNFVDNYAYYGTVSLYVLLCHKCRTGRFWGGMCVPFLGVESGLESATGVGQFT